ncbi:MAG: hypothetical protein JWN85_5059 [Gammaproteobacteria bacterium]|nr:hypothetical protein [Gammaproteobacteria bacterium]
MIRPAAFDYNPETALTNKMQRPDEEVGENAGAPALVRADSNGSGGARAGVATNADAGVSVQAKARAEFEGLANALASEGISVCAVDDTAEPVKPDAVFPNNWVSFHEDGTVVLYPMQAETRRRERRQDVIDAVVSRLQFRVSRVLDLTPHEAEGRFLEGTGSLILDHVERVAYAAVSPRTHPVVVEEWCEELGYEPFIFETFDRAGVPLYHTNVLMCLGARVAVIGTEAIARDDRARVLDRLRSSGRDVVEIGHDEVERFAGNMLELATWDEALGDCRVLVMSEAARRGLRADNFARLSASTDAVLAVPVPTIERLGGGSVRCMIAEVFLPV